jgi:16S rRNA A1518/A1519 N6-dimethyltransferase RsmA/KsgA/DIM1 with predicted DNA glycosylase/AP lyase activity
VRDGLRVLCVSPHSRLPHVQHDLEALRRTLSICFAHRRRTLRNNLRLHFDDSTRAEQALELAALDGGRRAETLTAEEFLNIAALWQRASLL